ncbi:MAG: ATP-dependent metallopeptidase FtsH/Yme1/Tma family protein [Micavibrio aeruginosavorus]|nr:ATP-dependent metallopeptidase FtsH/Yme1/Tma family protein [Micavibrio aeruginosavorus]
MNNFGRNLLFWLAVAVTLAFLFNVFQSAQTQQMSGGVGAAIAYSDFMADASSGRIADVTVKGPEAIGHYAADGKPFRVVVPDNENIVERLSGTGVRITAESNDPNRVSLMGVLLSWFPMLLLIGIWVFFMRQMQGKGGGGAMSFGKSRARMLTEAHGRVTFDDVAGIEEAKVELQEIVEFLKDPQKFQRLGGKIPKGALLVGSPGTGKTLIARAVAGEANVPFFTISGSDFVEMFVGVGASRVRDMFEQAKKNAPCIIFIDEIDAVGRHRGAGLGGGNDEREQTLNQLLVEMDGFEANEGVILLAATNRPDVLDPALLRPGRFDRQIVVPLPDINGRDKILKVHMKKVPLAKNVESMVIARGTPGFSGADLANLVNEAALLAARRGKRVVGMEEFEDAKDKVMMGAERNSMAMSDKEKKLTAYHEAVDKLQADLAVAMGGRVAEEIIFGKEKVTTGASSDIRFATDMARRMVTEWGYSDKLGPLLYSANQEEVFLGHSVSQTKNLSDDTASIIDAEIRRIVDAGFARAREVLTSNIDELHTLAKALLEYETLNGEEIKALLRGEPIIRDVGGDDTDDKKPKSSVPTGGSLGGSLPQGA